MKKLGLVAFLLAGLAVFAVLAGFVVYGYYQERQRKAEMKSMFLGMAKLELVAYVGQMQAVVGQEGKDELQRIADSFPKRDAGIEYSRMTVRTEGDDQVFVSQVLGVYMGSAAEKAGVLPGDDIVAIGGTKTEIRCATVGQEQCPSPESIQAIRDAVAAADTTTTTFMFRRPGAERVATLFLVPYGQDIHDRLTADLPGVYARLAALAPRVDALAKRAETLTEKNAESLYTEAKTLGDEIAAIQSEVLAYPRSRIILAVPERKTEARPEI